MFYRTSSVRKQSISDVDVRFGTKADDAVVTFATAVSESFSSGLVDAKFSQVTLRCEAELGQVTASPGPMRRKTWNM